MERKFSSLTTIKVKGENVTYPSFLLDKYITSGDETMVSSRMDDRSKPVQPVPDDRHSAARCIMQSQSQEFEWYACCLTVVSIV